MAGYTLKLDIYYFSLKKVIERRDVTRRGEARSRIVTEDNDSCFNTFFNDLYGDKDKAELFKGFTADFHRVFNNEFISSSDNTKAISITKEDSFRYRTIKNVIWGSFRGGNTNIEFEVYKRGNSLEPQSKVMKDDVATLHYFYKLWMPIDSNVGVLMIQSYTSAGCTILFKTLIEECFLSLGYKVYWGKCIPKNVIQRYLTDCSVYKLKILTKSKNDIEPLNPIFGVFKKSKYERFVNKFRIPLTSLMNLDNYLELLKNQLVALNIDYDKDRDDVVMFYKNSKNQKAHAKLSSLENIYPSIILDDSLKDPITERPLWDELDIFTEEILSRIKEEIGYTPK